MITVGYCSRCTDMSRLLRCCIVWASTSRVFEKPRFDSSVCLAVATWGHVPACGEVDASSLAVDCVGIELWRNSLLVTLCVDCCRPQVAVGCECSVVKHYTNSDLRSNEWLHSSTTLLTTCGAHLASFVDSPRREVRH